jgi:alcohol dehydrogenase (nicotinoprotein)
MKTKAGVLWELGKEWEVEELELDGPEENQVLIRYTHAGLCHSDEHLRHGDLIPRFPIVGGHEGAGIIEDVGPGVTRVKPGDHAVCSFIPNCGVCRFCASGQQSICDMGATILEGCLPGGRFAFHGRGQDLGAMCMLGTFSQYSVIHEASVVRVDDDLPLDKGVLVGCGVPTGFGSAVYAAKVEPGDTVAIYGIGGIGINAVQGAKLAGASNIIAVDPISMKREAAEQFGATHSVDNGAAAIELAQELTLGVGADKTIITVDVVNAEVVSQAFDATRKGGTVVITGLADPTKLTMQLSGTILTLFRKQVVGTLFGNANPTYDIPKMLRMYRNGDIKLDELVTRTYTLDEINQGYDDLLNGKLIRGVLVHDAA